MRFIRRIQPLALVGLLWTGACSRGRPAAEVPAPASATVPEPAPAPQTSSAQPAGPALSIREYHGAYSRGFEASWFIPCGAPLDDALWWVTLTDDALRQRDSLLKKVTRPATGALAVRWRGSTSNRMPAGQMGRGTRYLLVTQIIELRPLPSEGACLPVTRTS